MLHEAHLDPLFEAVADGIEQAILHVLWRAETVTGRNGHTRQALTEVLPDWGALPSRESP
jgi:D-aminopeptidase